MRVLVMALMAGGCGETVAIGDYDHERWKAMCESYVECDFLPDMDTCMRLMEFPGSTSSEARLVDAVGGGGVRYDAHKAADCVRLLRTWGCLRSDEPTRRELTESCWRVFEGTRLNGQVCLMGAECADGFCDFLVGCTEACCDGVCVGAEIHDADIPLGEPCSDTYECAFASYCDLSGVCQPVQAPGTVCQADQECGDHLECLRGPDPADVPRCGRRPKHGEPCGVPGVPRECDDYRDFCDRVTLRCVADRAIGESCGSPDTYGECIGYGRCSATGTCVEYPAEIGASCVGICLGNLDCVAGVCTAPEQVTDCYD